MSRLEPALRLHRHLESRHWRDNGLWGPDPGVRFNHRFLRFAKSLAPAFPWRDEMYYVQAQAYWILGNWKLWDLTAEEGFRDLALKASDTMLGRQQPEGWWPYPNPEWRHVIANAEGTWGSLGLLESYRQSGQTRFLEAALRWHAYLHEHIGFDRRGASLAANYAAGWRGARVLNNSAFVLRYLAELAEATGDDHYLEPAPALLTFLGDNQTGQGEFPYSVDGASEGRPRRHLQCFQYNAFMCLDLARYARLTGDASALDLVRRALPFLRTGLAADGSAHYACGQRYRTVVYHTAVVGAAMNLATQLGLADYAAESEHAFSHVLRQQRADGGFPFSRGDYFVLSDRRSYPRYEAMILYHLASRDGAYERPEAEKGARPCPRPTG